MAPTALQRVPRGLTARVLLVTIAFAMASGMMILLPSLARFRIAWLEARIDTAHLAIFALEATPDNRVSPELARQLLAHVGARGIVVHKPNMTLMLDNGGAPHVDETFDLRHEGLVMEFADALGALAQNGDPVMRVLDVSPKDPTVVVEVLLDERPLRRDMWGLALRAFGIATLISVLTGLLLYVSLRRLMVTPLRRLIAAMIAFRDDPEDARRVLVPEDRGDEIGLAQRELAAMQETVRQALRHKERLAALGTAVAKINHDLRNILTTARLVSDGLSASAAPEVRRVTPRILAAIDRAVALSSRTLSFAGEGAPPPVLRRFALMPLIQEVADLVGREGEAAFALDNAVPAGLVVAADRDQLFHVLHNLALNACEAGASRVVVGAEEDANGTAIDVSDDGPGLAPKARENLFRPFAGSARPGGTGLGLAIAREVMRAHGGDIALAESTGTGTRFVLRLPPPGAGDAAIPFADRFSASERRETPRARARRG